MFLEWSERCDHQSQWLPHSEYHQFYLNALIKQVPRLASHFWFEVGLKDWNF